MLLICSRCSVAWLITWTMITQDFDQVAIPGLQAGLGEFTGFTTRAREISASPELVGGLLQVGELDNHAGPPLLEWQGVSILG